MDPPRHRLDSYDEDGDSRTWSFRGNDDDGGDGDGDWQTFVERTRKRRFRRFDDPAARPSSGQSP